MANEFEMNADNITVQSGSGFVAAGYIVGQQVKINLVATETGGESTIIDKDFVIDIVAEVGDFDEDFDEDFD